MKTFLCLFALLLLPAIVESESGYVKVMAPDNRQLKLVVEAPHCLAANPSAAKEVGDVISFDMNMSGVVATETREHLPKSGGLALTGTDFLPWINAGYDMLVRGEYEIRGDDLTAEFRLYDVPNRKIMTAKRFQGKARHLRRFAHAFADEILRAMTGEKGCFTSHIAFVSTRSGNKEIAIMEWDGHNQMQLTKNGSINLNPDFSPDKREIIFTSYKRGNPDLYKRALSNTTETLLSNRKGLNITGTWSPDGSRIALALSKDGDSEIYTLARNGSRPVRLTQNPAIEVSPSWSPDGSRITFVSDRLGKPQIFMMNSAGGAVRRFTTSGDYNVNPRWSPKGGKIAYARREGNGFQIHSINADGSEDSRLTSTGNNKNPIWSPDGRFIAFSSNRDGGEGIYVMRADGGNQTRVSHGKGNNSQPTW